MQEFVPSALRAPLDRLDPHINSDQHGHPSRTRPYHHLHDTLEPRRAGQGRKGTVDDLAMKVRIKEWSAVATWGECCCASRLASRIVAILEVLCSPTPHFLRASPTLPVWDVRDPDDVCGICQNNFDGVCGSCKTPKGGDECPLREYRQAVRLLPLVQFAQASIHYYLRAWSSRILLLLSYDPHTASCDSVR